MRGFPRLVLAQATLLRRNVAYLVGTLGLAVISMLVFGWLFEMGAQAFSLGVVDEDGSAASQGLVQAFGGLESVELKEGLRPQELSALKDGERTAVIIIPQGFGEELAAGRAVLSVHYNDSDPIAAEEAVFTINAMVEEFNAVARGGRGPVVIEGQGVTARETRYIDFLTPGMVGLALIWGNVFAGIIFLTEWREMGVLRRLGVTPLRPAVLIASQAVSLALLSFAQAAIIFLLARLAFDVRVEGNYLLLATTLILGIACMLALGYVIGSFLNTMIAASAVANLLIFPMMFLGGSYWPMEPPTFLKPLVEAMPLTHLNDALREVVNKGQGLSDIGWNWAVLAAWGLVGFLISLRLFRWQ